MSDTEEDEDPPAPEADPTPDAADPLQQKRHRRKKETEREAIARVWRFVLSDKAGRAELWRLLTELTEAFNDMFPAGPCGFPDHAAKWFMDGKKAVGLAFYRERQVDCPELVHLMHLEHDPAYAHLKQRKTER